MLSEAPVHKTVSGDEPEQVRGAGHAPDQPPRTCTPHEADAAHGLDLLSVTCAARAVIAC